MLWLWGMAGAFVYAANACILDVWNATRPSDRHKALAHFAVALVTGAVFAQGFGAVFQGLVASGLVMGGLTLKADLDLVPAGLTVGWAANYLWPRILRKLGDAVDKDSSKGSAR